MCLTVVIVFVVSLCLLAASGVEAQVNSKEKALLKADFEKGLDGFFPLGDNADNTFRADQGAHGGKFCLAMKYPGSWASPLFPVTPFQFYKITLYSRITPPAPAAGQYAWAGHWAAYFYDKDGKILTDHYSYIDGSEGWIKNEACFRGKGNAAYCSIRLLSISASPLYVDDLSVTAVSHAEAAKWADEFYKNLTPINFTPAADRWQLIPKTMEALRQGKKWRVVMLGDSIVNDSGTGPWDTLVERMYPKAQLEVVTSVRGSTGCEYYKQENRVKPYVLDYNPDLIIIGGVSNGAAENVRTVIGQIRAAGCKAEILLITGAVSQNHGSHPKKPGWTPTVDPEGKGYRSDLLRLAADEQVEYLDITGPWGLTMLDAMNAGQAYEFYQRDILHANDRGRSILSHILAAYFAPKG